MDTKQFATSAPGKLVKVPEGGWAFDPNPLPTQLTLTPSAVKQLADAQQTLGELSGIGQLLPNPHLLIRPFSRREAVSSSRIEGTVTTEQELLLFELVPDEARNPDVQEVRNYVAALEHGLRRLEKLPVCLRLMKECHEVLMGGVRGEEKRPGEFRRIQNYIAKSGQTIHQARFVPPPVKEMMRALDELEKYLHSENDIPFLVRVALIHYQFEVIHPFGDGNGRIGRLLIPFLLCERKLLSQPLLYLSSYFETHREEYADHLLRTSQTGDWEKWIHFFLTATAEQSRDAVRRVQALMKLWQEYRDRLRANRSSARLLALVDRLFAWPAITIGVARDYLKVSYPSAKNSVEKLIRARILEEIPGRKYNRLFLAPEIIRLVEADHA